MVPFLYRCPNTGDNVQAWAADDPEDDEMTYVQVTCLACAQAHLVDPKSGRVIGGGRGVDAEGPKRTGRDGLTLRPRAVRSATVYLVLAPEGEAPQPRRQNSRPPSSSCLIVQS
jgi:hypothetical protein